MRGAYEVEITPQAQEQMQEISQYIAFELQAPEAAFNLIDVLEEAIMSLSQFPKRAPLTAEEPWRNLGIRRMPVKNFLVYFQVYEEVHKVLVTAVLYSRRDQAVQLAQAYALN